MYPRQAQAALSHEEGRLCVRDIDSMHACLGDCLPDLPRVSVCRIYAEDGADPAHDSYRRVRLLVTGEIARRGDKERVLSHTLQCCSADSAATTQKGGVWIPEDRRQSLSITRG